MRANGVLTLAIYRIGCRFGGGLSMYEVVEIADEWVVRRAGLEVARYDAQASALEAVTERLRLEDASDRPVSFAMRFQNRRAD
jgi:hypothetical protein